MQGLLRDVPVDDSGEGVSFTDLPLQHNLATPWLTKGTKRSLSEHTVNKHNKTVAECFPGVEIKP